MVTVTVNNGTLDINNFLIVFGVITLVNDGSIIDGGGSTAVLTTTGSMTLQSGTISARIGGTVGTTLNKSTTDRVTLSGDNSLQEQLFLWELGIYVSVIIMLWVHQVQVLPQL